MKVLQFGSLDPIWAGKILTCRFCEAKFELEVGDPVRTVMDSRDGDYYRIPCPTCSGSCTISVRSCR